MIRKILSSFVVVFFLLFSVVSFSDTKENLNTNSLFKTSGDICRYSSTLTFDKMVNQVAKDTKTSNRLTELKLLKESVDKGLSEKTMKKSTYRIISKKLYVTSSYHPTVKFYCRTSESNYHWSTKDIIYISIDKKSNGITKTFNGGVFANLENPARLWFNINGDFHNRDFHNKRRSNDVSVKVAKNGFASFSDINASDHYSYYFEDHTIRCGQ